MVRALGAVDAVAAGAVGADASIAGVSGAGVGGVGTGTARDGDDRSTRATLSFGTGPLGRSCELRCAAAGRDAREVGEVLVDAALFGTALSRTLDEAVEEGVDDDPESSADATHGGVATAPPMPRAMAKAPIRPMWVDASAENMGAFSHVFGYERDQKLAPVCRIGGPSETESGDVTKFLELPDNPLRRRA